MLNFGHVGQPLLRGDVRYGLTTQCKICRVNAFYFIEGQLIARRVVSEVKVIRDEMKLGSEAPQECRLADQGKG